MYHLRFIFNKCQLFGLCHTGIFTSVLVYERYAFNIQMHTKVALFFEIHTEISLIKTQLFLDF